MEANTIFIKLIGRKSPQIYTNNNFELRIIIVYARNSYRRQRLSPEDDPGPTQQIRLSREDDPVGSFKIRLWRDRSAHSEVLALLLAMCVANLKVALRLNAVPLLQSGRDIHDVEKLRIMNFGY